MKLKANVLYYFREGEREYKRAVEILENLGIEYIPIKIHDRMLDENFIELMLEYCHNGFDDLIKNPKKMVLDIDYDTITTKQLIKLIAKEKDNILRPVWFLGLSGGEGVITSTMREDEFTIYKKYNEREMSEIYG